MATNNTTDQLNAGMYNDSSHRNYSMDATEDETSSQKIAVVLMLGVFSLVGVVGNAIAFYIFLGRRATSTSVIFILALAGTDFFTCLVTIPWTIAFELLSYNLVYDVACKAYMFIITSTVPFSAYIMVGIALDRYFCICHPFLFAFTVARARAVILCMAVPAIIFGVITAMSYGMYIIEYGIRQADSNHTGNSSAEEFGQHSTILHFDQNTLEHILSANNMTKSRQRVIYYEQCVNNTFVFSQEFLESYKKIHALNFLVAYVSVAVLYVLIYKSIFTRRANKARRKKKNMYPITEEKFKDNQREETQMTTIINGKEGSSPKVKNTQTRKDGRCARKITLTARNDTSGAGRPETQKVGFGMISSAERRREERMTLLEESNDSFSNVTASHTTSAIGGPTTESEDLDRDDDCGVYLGPRTRLTLKPGLTTLGILNNSGGGPRGADTDKEVTYKSNNLLLNPRIDLISDDKIPDPKCDDIRGLGNSPDCSCPEEKPLLPLSPESPVAPPTSLPLRSSPSQFSSHLSENRSPAAELEHKRPSECKPGQPDIAETSLKRKRPSTVREKNLIANIKTAFMLFIVTLVFLIAFLPALLMANGLIPINLIVFYGYFIYNVANPFIYAFMNQNFREDLKKIMTVCKR